MLRLEALDPRVMLTADPIVTFNTSFGSFQVELFPDAAPLTVANFLKYVNAGEYSNTIIHRVVDQTGFEIVQGGGFSASSAPFPPAPSHIDNSLTPTDSVPLESTLGNTAGTIAMARTTDPNSGGSEYFFNVVDDSAALPSGASGGYTVFGQVLGSGLTVLQQIVALQTLNDYFPSYSGGTTDPNNLLGPMPLVNFDPTTATAINLNNLVVINSVTQVGTFSGTVFDDQNGDSSINGSDFGLAGFTVYLDANNDGQLDNGELSAVTDSSGNYSFANTPVGSYVVRVAPQAGWTQTSPVAATPAFGAQRFTLNGGDNLTNENFGFSVVLSTPAAPVLASGFDTGSLTNDGKTDLSALQFVVTGVQTGATVTLKDGQTIIGSAVAQGTSVTITPAAPFADGNHSITATQSLDGQTSSTSPVGSVTVKTTAPVITSTPPANAEVGALYTYNVTTDAATNTLTLLNPLTGMSLPINSTTLTWTPSSSQIGNQTAKLVVTDVFGNTAQQTISIAVNGAPFLPAIPDQKVNQGSQLSLTIPATDLDSLTYSLGTGAPVGASINPTTGLFTWTPSSAITAGVYAITINVVDPGGLSATQVMNVTVNTPPVVGAIATQSVDEGVPLTFQIPASDQDQLQYALLGTVPAGASVNSTGQFSWQPTTAQAGSSYDFTVKVTDTGGLSVDRTFTVTVVKTSGTFSGTVFIDQNGDGQIDGPDAGNPGFTVYIDANDDGQLNAGELSTVTDANGNYSFDVAQGNYVVRVAPQAGWSQTSPNSESPAFGAQRFTVHPNDDLTDENFGFSVVLATPAAPVLASGFDTGALTNDGKTDLSSLQFVVGGVQSGATVTLYDGENVVGSAIAQGTSVTIVPTSPFADGGHTMTAVQSLLGQTSSTSSASLVTVKTTPPVITSAPPSTAVVGALYTYNVTTDSEIASLSVLDPLTGLVGPTLSSPLTWTPSASQAGHQSTTIVATDIFGNTTQQTISVDVNAPPAFPTIANQLVNQGSQLSVSAAASDLNTVTYSLGDGAPTGAAIDPTTGLFTWTPTTDVAPGAYAITINAVDTAGLGASQILNVTVNAPPVVATIPPQTVDERTTLTFQVPATDQDALQYSLVGNVPQGATVNQAGLFSWQPTEAQGGVIYQLTVRVTDTGGLSVDQNFSVTVNKVDSPPVINSINRINVTVGQTVSFNAVGQDTDLPFAGIKYSLDPGAPDGASIDPDTGAFTWQVPANYPVGTTTITVRVTDQTTNQFSAATPVQIVVNAVAVAPPVGPGSPVTTVGNTGGGASGASPASGAGAVDAAIVQDLLFNPAFTPFLSFPTSNVLGLTSIPTGPAVLQQLAKTAVDRAMVGHDAVGGRLPSGIVDFVIGSDTGLPQVAEQLAKEALPDGEAGDGNADEPKGGNGDPDKSGANNEQSPTHNAVHRNGEDRTKQQGQMKIRVAPQAEAWPTAQSFKSQVLKAQALKVQSLKAESRSAKALNAQTLKTRAVVNDQAPAAPSHPSAAQAEQTADRSKSEERNGGKRVAVASAVMIPLLIGQLEARDKLAEKNRRKQARGR